MKPVSKGLDYRVGGWDLLPPKDISTWVLGSGSMPKTFAELQRIALERRLDSLAGLSAMDLDVLLATLNRQRVPLADEEIFCGFYLEVVQRVRNR